MRFSELIERIRERGVQVVELRVKGAPEIPTPLSDGTGGAKVDPEILGVCEDSRKAKPGDLFVARGGTKVNGATYVVDAISRGAVAVVGEMTLDLEGVASATVADANMACALLAHEVAGNPTAAMKMIGITGTKGKTTVAYLLRSVLKAAGHKVGMIGTVEIDDGNTTTLADMTTPGSVELVELFSRMKANGVTHCVMEVSSHALHQRRVAGIDFAVAIFTNLTGDHLDYHKTMEEYAAAKAILFEGLKKDAVAIVNIDDPWGKRMAQKSKARVVPYCVTDRPRTGPGMINPIELPPLPGDPPMGLGNKPTYPDVVPPGGFAAYIWRMNSHGMGIGIGIDGPALGQNIVGQAIVTPLVGRHNCYNIASAYAAAMVLGALTPAEDINRRIELMKVWRKSSGAPGRLQRVAGYTAFSVFVDYAHTHDALENVLTALRATMGRTANEVENPSRDRKGATHVQSSPNGSLPYGRGSDGQLICVFGCGGDRDRTKRPKMAAVAERLADKVIVTSDNPRTENPQAIIDEICAGFSQGWREQRVAGGQDARVTVEPDRRTAIRRAIAMAKPGDVVLLAGKGHENYQIIGTTKHHFDDVEEAQAALREVLKTSTM